MNSTEGSRMGLSKGNLAILQETDAIADVEDVRVVVRHKNDGHLRRRNMSKIMAFDVVPCQQGLQFSSDRAAAALEMRRVLAEEAGSPETRGDRSRKTLSSMVWRAPPRVSLVLAPIDVLRLATGEQSARSSSSRGSPTLPLRSSEKYTSSRRREFPSIHLWVAVADLYENARKTG